MSARSHQVAEASFRQLLYVTAGGDRASTAAPGWGDGVGSGRCWLVWAVDLVAPGWPLPAVAQNPRCGSGPGHRPCSRASAAVETPPGIAAERTAGAGSALSGVSIGGLKRADRAPIHSRQRQERLGWIQQPLRAPSPPEARPGHHPRLVEIPSRPLPVRRGPAYRRGIASVAPVAARLVCCRGPVVRPKSRQNGQTHRSRGAAGWRGRIAHGQLLAMQPASTGQQLRQQQHSPPNVAEDQAGVHASASIQLPVGSRTPLPHSAHSPEIAQSRLNLSEAGAWGVKHPPQLGPRSSCSRRLVLIGPQLPQHNRTPQAASWSLARQSLPWFHRPVPLQSVTLGDHHSQVPRWPCFPSGCRVQSRRSAGAG